MEDTAARLGAIGLASTAVESKSSLFRCALDAIGAGRRATRTWWVPGRIEFLGKHTDYAGGPSLVCAVERGFAVAVAPRTDRRLTFHDAVSSEKVEHELDGDIPPRRDHWSNYPFTVARRVARNFPGGLSGVDVAFASDLPAAAGLSSSSALVVATFLGLSAVNGLEARPEYRAVIDGLEALAGYLGAIENGAGYGSLAGDTGVGTHGGSEDHTAILCAQAGALVQYTYVPVRFERAVPLPNTLEFAVASSGVIAAKAAGALERYNRASSLAAEALAIWHVARGSTAPTLNAALGEAPNGIEDFREVLRDRPEVMARVVQFDKECRFVHEAGNALAARDLDRLGRLIDESQAEAARLLLNQVPETVALARSARDLGAVAASAFGAGFGGSVYALVRASEASDFLRRWAEQYATAFPNRVADASFFTTYAGPPATSLV